MVNLGLHNKQLEEEQLALAEKLFLNYPKHVLAFTLAKCTQFIPIHPELLEGTIEMSQAIPLQLFTDAIKERQCRDLEKESTSTTS